ncbi:hypothetical protein PMI01_01235 [Caulobacter sp. AP07]|uniref:hypothetical protein n=1 Tax=Caulobacter sp. AP07 TaxID=1144304 RepID=UPI000271F25F|nr:hypothetical protein [Caulobacter sp. AP07]EJL35688.1 hypothetical protein PMI01_01235 [Caulobacter sp. AP07]
MAAWFTAGGAIIAATVSALVSYLVAYRSVYINAVTAERSKWIEALRSTISKYSGAAGRVSARRALGAYAKDQDWASDTEHLQTLLSDLTLRLNPNEAEAQNLLRSAMKLDQAARLHSPAAVILANEIMIRHAQWAAKVEWDRVKEEASGVMRAPTFAWRKWRRGRAYAKFLKGAGSLDRLDAIGSGVSDADLTLLRSEMDT